eukprot:TRINITY_DN36929_c0_g1_i1.p1 TRINITY_DN36929_c0_g1~~TRINITY_DN36929_c0_g1_i1.p1  ORF type:complete len:209 (-),score=21.00 TRINITY_DN36929_c0_g1_i1:149-775(-)
MPVMPGVPVVQGEVLAEFGPNGDVNSKEFIRRAKAHARIRQKHCIQLSLIITSLVAVVINAAVWGVWGIIGATSGEQARGGKWPLWVTFGTVMAFVTHLVSILPFCLCRSSGTCPRWLWCVLLIFVMVNFASWILYYFLQSDECREHQKGCDYEWPWWVSGATLLAAGIMIPLTCLINYWCSRGGVESWEIHDELHNNSTSSESEASS